MRKFLFSSLLLVAFVAAAASVDHKIVVEPSQPEPGEPFQVTVSGTWRDSCVPRPQRTEIADSTIRLIFFADNSDGCLAVLTPWSETVSVTVAAGTYRIEAIAELADGEPILLAARDLTVTNDVDPAPANFELFLAPVMYEGPGALGSEWTTQLSLYNDSDTAIDPWEWLLLCPPGEPCPDTIPPRTSLVLGPQQLLTWVNGYVFAIPRDRADDLHATLHARDLSRQSESWGTEIPVVREDDLPSKIVLLNVPLDDRFRRMLRIYDLRGIDGVTVSMRWFRADTGEEVASERVLLRTVARCAIGPCWLPDPAAASIPIEPPFPAGLEPGDRLRIEIEPASADMKVWAFVSITNNESQQVTTITPQ
ncbi:MAG: hypothetical protein ACRD2J_05545 [Thermoanaerobaculia bacterium]